MSFSIYNLKFTPFHFADTCYFKVSHSLIDKPLPNLEIKEGAYYRIKIRKGQPPLRVFGQVFKSTIFFSLKLIESPNIYTISYKKNPTNKGDIYSTTLNLKGFLSPELKKWHSIDRIDKDIRDTLFIYYLQKNRELLKEVFEDDTRGELKIL